MQISDLRVEVRTRLVDFAWDQWAQMGVSAAPRRTDRWAADPEALLLFTFEIARAAPRIFDEVLDWLALNQRLVSVQRLRNLCRDEADRSLAEASLAWATRTTRKKSDGALVAAGTEPTMRRVFRGIPADPQRADPDFLAHGG